LKAGYDVKSNDVIGLSQRGGKVWGSIRLGEKVYSPNIPPASGDVLLGMEPLEGLRWSGMLKKGGLVILNEAQIPPVPVMDEKETYPENIEETLKANFEVITINAATEGNKLGSSKVANMFLVGIMAKRMDIPKEIWQELIKKNVPERFSDMNLKAFEYGYYY